MRIVLLLLILCAPAVRAQNIHVAVPDSVDPEKFFLFYIHDNILSAENITPLHPQYGRYQYEEIVNRFATEGFMVISYPRETGAHPYLFAEEIATEIRKLLNTGVSPTHVSIVGAGQGGAITVLISMAVRNPDINVILLSSCTEAYNEYWVTQGELLWGRVLSIHHPAASGTAACMPYLEHCRGEGVPLAREIVLQEQSSPGFWLQPTTDWVLPAILWASGKHDMVGNR